MPPCAAMRVRAPRRVVERDHLHPVAELAEASRRPTPRPGRVPTTMISNRRLFAGLTSLIVELVVVPLLLDRARRGSWRRASSSPQLVVLDATSSRRVGGLVCGHCNVDRRGAAPRPGSSRCRRSMTPAKTCAKRRRSVLYRGLVMPRLWNMRPRCRGRGGSPSAMLADDVHDRRRPGRCKLYTRLLYGSPRTKCEFALPHVRSIRWKIRNSSTMIAGPAHRARRVVGGDVVALRLVLRAGRAAPCG